MALPIIRDDPATAAIDGLAEAHPHLGPHIRELGNVFLHLSHGLRDGRNGASRTYDLSFINDKGAFACLTAEPGKYNNATGGRLQVQLRHQGERELELFKLKQTASEIKRGWHATQLAAGEYMAPLLADIARWHIP